MEIIEILIAYMLSWLNLFFESVNDWTLIGQFSVKWRLKPTIQTVRRHDNFKLVNRTE